MASVARRQVVNIALAVVAVGLVVAVVVTTGHVTTSEKVARQKNVLGAWRQDDLDRIEIDRTGKQKLVLEREPPDDAGLTGWRMLAPIHGEAEDFALDKLLGALQFATAVRRIKPGEVDDKAFGLGSPRMVVRLAMGRIHYKLELGKPAVSPKGAAYLRVGGQNAPHPGVVIAEQGLVKALSINADELRGRQMMPYMSTELAHLTLEGEGGTRRLRRAKGWNGWRFDGMQHDYAVGRAALDRVLLQFARTKADHFISAKSAHKAQDGAQTLRVTMQPSDKKDPQGVVTVGGACPDSRNDIVAMREKPDPAFACVPGNVMQGLSTPADALLDRGLFSLHQDEVESLAVIQGKKKLELERKQKGFLMRSPEQTDVALEAGNKRIQRLLAVRGKLLESPDLEKLGLSPPAGHITLKSAAENESKVITETVLLGKPASDGSVAVQRNNDGAVLELDRESARTLTADASLLRKRQILDFSASELSAIDLHMGSVHEALVRTGAGSYDLTSPVGFDVDAGLASDLAEALGSLAADRWVADRDDGSFGLDKPVVRVALTLEKKEAGTEQHTLVVGSRTSRGNFASMKGDQGVFVLPRSTVETLQTLLFDRSKFVVRPGMAARITLQGPDAKVVLEKRGTAYVQSGGSTQLSPAAIQQITDALSSMRAETALHVGPARPAEGFEKPALGVRVELEASDGGRPITTTWHVGKGDSWRDVSMYYARVDGVNATFAITRSKVKRLLDAL